METLEDLKKHLTDKQFEWLNKNLKAKFVGFNGEKIRSADPFIPGDKGESRTFALFAFRGCLQEKYSTGSCRLVKVYADGVEKGLTQYFGPFDINMKFVSGII